jgi:hypothetical protein
MHLPFSEDLGEFIAPRSQARKERDLLIFSKLGALCAFARDMVSDLLPIQSHSPMHGEST